MGVADAEDLKGPDLGLKAIREGQRQLDERLVDAVRSGDTVTIRRMMAATPAWVNEEFFEAKEPLVRYHDQLATTAAVRGIVGPREVPRLWDRHILNCVAVSTLFPKSARVVDIGSGAGLPGVALAIVRPDLNIVLVESALRRTEFLKGVVRDLGLPVRVVRGRAESREVVAAVGGSDIVTSRAVAPLAKLAAWSLPLLRQGGHILAMKGDSAQQELKRDRSMIEKVGGINAKVVEVWPRYSSEPTFVVDVTKRS